ncbi:recombinase RmuC [Tepidimonas fonticaldi]|uniref:Recombinase RmuC n=1 Tax=Tepidimonas fonticaldi TaxID=1101373 RepID=A0A1A6DSW8_9BURK|nr:DNA recombination protein RmuC [Tepidimonas fonticaldi]OBS29895.1 recombinase RmuC [Tepidimonas fonticaldi]
MTPDTLMLAGLGLGLINAVLLLVLLLRRPRFDTPADLAARIGVMEQALQGLAQAGARADAGLTRLDAQLRDFTQNTHHNLDAKLALMMDESRHGRNELTGAFQQFAARLEQRIGGFDASMGQRFDSLQHALLSRLAEATQAQTAQFAQAQADAATARQELTAALEAFRKDLSTTLKALSDETQTARLTLAQNAHAFEQQIQNRFEALGQITATTLDTLKKDVSSQLGTLATALKDLLEATSGHMHRQFATLQEAVAQQLQTMTQGWQQSAEQLRHALNERLAAIQADNTAKLEEMRRTVDEKLHATLEQRLGDSFRLVSERLEQVHAGLGEMKHLAGSVGDLKRVMTNVRTRGTWGEVQLGAIIESLLTAEQYDRNVKTVEGSADLVEYAIKMPGKNDHEAVWLPIDSKYPVEDYQRLLDAHDSGDKEQVLKASNAFAAAVKAEAKKIREKYVAPPKTTDFAILFVPTEGLFAEICRIPGMVETLQNDHRVVIAGPTTLAAMLNSLRLGFRTLAIEKRSSEVWNILASVKTEFRKFGDTIEATRKSIDNAAKKFSDIGVRTRAIERRLRGVEELPADTPTGLEAADLLALDDEGTGDPMATNGRDGGEG